MSATELLIGLPIAVVVAFVAFVLLVMVANWLDL